MATYSGALASNGLPELADEGEVDFPAMTLRRALHVIQVDEGGNVVPPPSANPAPGSSPDFPAYVVSYEGDTNRVRVEGGTVGITDGTDTASVISLATQNALAVGVVDGSGNLVTAFGGGTQYTEGDVDGTITGTAALWEDAGNTLRSVSAATPLPVNIVAGSSSGTEYTVNAVAPADPVGPTFTMERDDQLAALSEVEGDWTNPRSTSKGALWVAIADTAGDPVTSFGGGTEYTVNAVAPADPVGATFTMERDDQLAALSEVEGDWTNPRATSQGALWVAIPDVSGNPITSFGGGTQYTEADVDVSVTGTAAMWKDADGVLRAISAASPLPITVMSDATATKDPIPGSSPEFPAYIASYEGGTNRVRIEGGTLDISHNQDTPFRVEHAGVSMLAVRNDQLAATLNHVDQAYGVLAVNGNGALAVQGQAQMGASVYVTGTTGNRLLSGYAVYNDTTPSAATEGRFDAYRMSVNRNLYMQLRSGNGTEVGADVFDLASSNPLAVAITDGTGTQITALGVVGGGTEATAQRVTIANDSTGVLSIDDNGASLTVDGTIAVSGSVAVTNAALSVVGGGVEATALRVTVASDSTGVLSIDDNGGSLTVDGTVAVSGSVAITNAALSVVGGGVEATALRVTVATDSTGVLSVDDNGGSLTVDGTVAVSGSVAVTNAALAVVGGGVEATALRVTVATDSTGVLSVDDNGGTLTVDAPVGTPVNVQIGDGTRTATVRDTGATDSLNVAIVDATGAQITTFGGGTEYTVNAVAPADPVGATFTMERDDQLAALAEVEGDWTNPRATAKGALWVALADSAGDPITSFGGGTQYTEGDVDTTITGTALMLEDAGSVLVAAPGNVADGMRVNLGFNNEVEFTEASIDLLARSVALYASHDDEITETRPEHSNTQNMTALTVSTAAVLLAPVNLARKSLLITNNGSGTLYVGNTSSVTTSGSTMGSYVGASGGSYADSEYGRFIGEVWGIYSASASVPNVAVSDRS